ncbi:MAG: TetM/TetW/TetO/TetS family tetracycline resistance ribosomal protection protein [Lachnospiraceae bacterium]|nr:TetM/TetW/TetO/TetS family tetracycline resistance ribosomal protection protein [Lachnospiraceae bacterium]
MKQLCMGILAHVDAGKTTLSEALLYKTGVIRKAGRVDHQDAFLDTQALEKQRGITILSKQAVFDLGDRRVTLLDTPGHVDFSAEMERVLQVLDLAILVVSGKDGVQSHTRTLWKLLERYHIPVILFVNKMDQLGNEKDKVLQQLKETFSSYILDFSQAEKDDAFWEEIAMADEALLNRFLEEQKGATGEEIRQLVGERKLFPCYFGSALKMEGVDELLEGIGDYGPVRSYPTEFGARIFKIARDESGNRLTYLKVTGGSLKVKQTIPECEEKIEQIRIYSGSKYEAVSEARAGCVCAVTGLTGSKTGEGLGAEKQVHFPVLTPVLTYRIVLPEGVDAREALPKLRELEEEDPSLHLVWEEEKQEILVRLMGEVQTEVLKSMIADRFAMEVSFDSGSILYKETIASVVEGVGHYEPLRHYAEVHLLLEPGEPGSGLVFESKCTTEELATNWQRLILTHLEEREHRGVLTGAPITDLKISVVGGRAHNKHTEGGDFRQATYRAVRQGLRQAKGVLLEPWYEFVLKVPQSLTGRAMTDLDRMQGKFEPAEQDGETTVITGIVPVSESREYADTLRAYSRGEGEITFRFHGYFPCHNAEDVIREKGYVPDLDLRNTADSVFCAHGAGFVVPWQQVPKYMHVESYLTRLAKQQRGQSADGLSEIDPSALEEAARAKERAHLSVEEVDSIIRQTFYANKRGGRVASGIPKSRMRKADPEMDARIRAAREAYESRSENRSGAEKQADVGETDGKRTIRDTKKPEYLLVDGYNNIFAWPELNELAQLNIDSARGSLLDILCNYQSIRGCELIVVFDAYRVEGHAEEFTDYLNIHVVYTREAQTADAYIEHFAHEHAKHYDVWVATSDGLEQIIVRGEGCNLISAREFREDVLEAGKRAYETYQSRKTTEEKFRHTLGDYMEDAAEADGMEEDPAEG